MSAASQYSLEFWQTFSEVGFWLVIFGVFGESTELIAKWAVRCRKKRLPKRLERSLLPLESIFWIILCIGLAVEFFGGRKASVLANSENTRLNRESADMRARAAGLEATNLVLRSKVLELEASVQPRMISLKQSGF